MAAVDHLPIVDVSPLASGDIDVRRAVAVDIPCFPLRR